MKKFVLIPLIAGLSPAVAPAVTITVANNVPNGSASEGSGSGNGALTTTSGSIASNLGLPVTTYSVSNIDLTSAGGTANESFTFTVSYSQAGGSAVQFNGFGNISVTGNGNDNMIDGPEDLSVSIALGSSTFGGLSLTGFTDIKLGAVGAGEAVTVTHGGGSFTADSTTQDWAVSGTSLSLDPAAGTLFNFQGFTADFEAVPEPSIAFLSTLGLLALARRRR